MNWDQLTGNWKQIKGKIREQWGHLTDDDVERIAGKRDQLIGKIQECYGIAKDDAERQVKDWEDRNEHNPHFKTKADNYLQFAPIAVVYGMNAIGIKGEHNIGNQTYLLLKAEIIMNAIVHPLKKIAQVLRPDGSNSLSFPSGHTAQAFLSAEFLRKEYGKKYPWVAAGGYIAAISVGALRILNNKHWITDVMTGAGIGIFSLNLAYLTQQKNFPFWEKKIQFMPIYNGHQPGIYLNCRLGK